MKITSLVPLVTILATSIAWAAEPQPAASQLQAYPKNLARQHLGSNLFVFNSTTQAYAPTEASAAWLDDDATTGWPILAGKQQYLLVLSEPEMLSNFSISARPASGTITLYGGDQPAIPGDKSWMVIAKDIPFDSVNHRTLGKSFSRLAKYVLIETDIAEPGPLFSLYLYGEKPAVSYTLRQREQAIDAAAIFGPYVNNPTTFNVQGLHASGRTSYANSPDGSVSWQKAIDDNPETALRISGSTSEAGAVFALGESRSVSRLSVLTDPGTKGQLDFYVVDAAPADTAPAGGTMTLTGRTPTVSMVFDGSNPRASMDVPDTTGAQIAVRWTPISSSDTFALREISAFSGLTLDTHEVGGTLPAVADFGGGGYEDASKDGKTFKDIVDPKKNPEPIAAGPGSSPYLPGSLGFPPIKTGRVLPPVEPESN